MASTVKRLLLFALCLGLPFLVGYMCLPLSGNGQLVCNARGRASATPPFLWLESVWQGLYILMGLSVYIMLQASGGKRQKVSASVWYGLQLAALGVWGGLFFTVAAWVSCAGILFLDALVGACMLSFKKVSSGAAIFLAPYWAWLLFATCLNIAFAVVS